MYNQAPGLQAFGSMLLGGTQIPYKDTEETEPNTSTGKTGYRSKDVKFINYRYHCITRMQQYETKSFEELRCEDYIAKRKTGFRVLLPNANSKPTFGINLQSSSVPTPMSISPSPSTTSFSWPTFPAPAGNNTSCFGIKAAQHNPGFSFNNSQPFGSSGQTTFGTNFVQNSFASPNPFLNQNQNNSFQFNNVPQNPIPFINSGVTTSPFQVPQFQFSPTPTPNSRFAFPSPLQNTFQPSQYGFNPWIQNGWPGNPFQTNFCGPGYFGVIPVPLYCPPPIFPQTSLFSFDVPGFPIPLSCTPHRELPNWNCDKQTFDKAMKKASDDLAPYLHIAKYIPTPEKDILSLRGTQTRSYKSGDTSPTAAVTRNNSSDSNKDTPGIWGSIPFQHNGKEYIDILTPKLKTTTGNFKKLSVGKPAGSKNENLQLGQDPNSAAVKVGKETPMEVQDANYKGQLHIPVGISKSIPTCKHCGNPMQPSSRDDTTKTENNVTRSCGVILTGKDYYCQPSIKELDSLTDASGNCMVENFCVGHLKYGNVIFEGTMNVAGLNLDKLIKFSHKEFYVYPDTELPAAGTEINRPCLVTLEQIWPWSMDKVSKVTNVQELKEMDYEKRLRKACARFQGEFLEYNPETGRWTFKIEQFVKAD